MSLQTFFDNLALLSDAPNGIAKLRELILQFALKGKLVPQSPIDKPASDLLERVAVERKKLLGEKRIKKLREVEEDFPSSIKNKTPTGWRVEWLGNLAHAITKGATPTTYGHTFQSEGIRFIKVENVKNNRIVTENVKDFISEEAHKSQARSQLESGDVLFSIAGTIGETCIVKETDLPANTNQALAIIRGTKTVFHAEFLKLQLDSFVANDVRDKARGGAMNNVSLGDLKELLVHIPPFEEQKRIVAKVDQLMRLCDEMKARQQTRRESRVRLNNATLSPLHNAASLAQSEFEQAAARLADNFATLYSSAETVGKLRSTILQLAVQGKLVPQTAGDEPGSVLLERVSKEKRRVIKEGNRNNKKPLTEIKDDEKVFELPEGWSWVRLGDVVDHRLGKMLDKSKNKGKPYPYLRNTNVQWLRFDLSHVKEMRFEDSELKEYEVRVGDLLVCEGGEPGRCAIWNGQVERIMFQKAIHRVRPFGGIQSWFLLYRLLADAMTGYLEKHFTGATIKHFTGQELARYVVGLPPLEEQKRIVAKVNQLMGLCAELETKLRQAEADSEKLMNAAIQHVLESIGPTRTSELAAAFT